MKKSKVIRKGLPSLKKLRFWHVAKKIGNAKDNVWAKYGLKNLTM